MNQCKNCKKIMIGMDQPSNNCEHLEVQYFPTPSEEILKKCTDVLKRVEAQLERLH